MNVRSSVAPILSSVASVLGVAACSSTPTPPSAAPSERTTPAATAGTAGGTSTPPARATTVPPVVRRVGVTKVSPAYRQGLARVGDRWIFATNNGLFLTSGDTLDEAVRVGPVIPDDLAAEGYDHVGDPDIDLATGLLWAPLERPDKDSGKSRMAAFDPETFAFVASVEVAQHHAAFVTIDVDTRIAYSQDQFGGTELLRYDIGDGKPGTPWTPLTPLALDREVDRVQGADILDGVLWLSTDDENDGVYRVPAATGQVEAPISLENPTLEGEGIDVSPIVDGAFSGSVHVLAAGGIEDGRVEHFEVSTP